MVTRRAGTVMPSSGAQWGLLDTNVVLDWLLDRKPWSDQALGLWQHCESGVIIPSIPASVTTDIYYIIRRLVSVDAAWNAITRIVGTLELLPVTDETIQLALQLPLKDFEDNVAIACAQQAGLDFIVTRDQDGFEHAPMRVLSPEVFPVT